MAIICRDHRLLFIMVPGTGCSVVGKTLIEEFGGEWIPSSNIIVDGRVAVQRKHSRLPDLIKAGLLSPQEVQDYLVFATVRNPFDRLVTYYQRLVGTWVDYSMGVRRRAIERIAESADPDWYNAEIVALTKSIRKSTRRQRLLRLSGFNLWLQYSLIRHILKSGQCAHRGEYNRHWLFPMLEGVNVVMRQEQLDKALNYIIQSAGISKIVSLPNQNITQGKRDYQEYYSSITRSLMTRHFKKELDKFGYYFGGTAGSYPLVWLDQNHVSSTTEG